MLGSIKKLSIAFIYANRGQVSAGLRKVAKIAVAGAATSIAAEGVGWIVEKLTPEYHEKKRN